MAAQIDKLKDPSWAWAVYEPDAERPWNLALAGHLYRRAAFGAGWEQLQQALSDGPQRTIDKLLRPKSKATQFNRTYDDYEAVTGSVDQLRAWWLRRMIQTPYPLLEKMTLFWHSYFATNATEVKNARLMQQQIRLLRSQALGSFRTLLEGISQDPAMLIWLGAEANRKARPNENFARALMENFTLGPGHYTAKDLQEASRAFTGWFVLRSKLRYIPREHDDNEKQILGRKGNFTRDDVLRIILEQPATSRRIVRKLYRWLISETELPEEDLIAPLAKSFADGYNILNLVEIMLRSNLFFSAAAYRRRIKGPVEFAIGIVNALEGSISTTQLANDLTDLGQDLYNPPTIKGWAGGMHWINSTAIVARQNLASALLQGKGPYGNKLNPRAIAQRHGCTTPESARRFLLDLLLQSDLDSDVYDSLQKPVSGKDDGMEEQTRSLAYAIVTLPEFQLA
ncbi:MAG: hypothetical protein AMJ75_08710 [Phycisphaerae bacterium SM1_79]|nr:MAG: hypothetical protein AMJ75_08710 [Phycisphaerae bacterium SM1_79]